MVKTESEWLKIAEQYYEFNIIPQSERYYNEDSTYGVYFFSTKDDIPELKEFNEDPFNQNSSVGKGCTLTGKMQKLYILFALFCSKLIVLN